MTKVKFTGKPGREDTYEVGNRVEVYCDHEDAEGERVRDWLIGIVVQVDPKIVAVQFIEKVYLTDGWMVPDHVLWCPQNSKNMRHKLKQKRRPRAE